MDWDKKRAVCWWLFSMAKCRAVFPSSFLPQWIGYPSHRQALGDFGGGRWLKDHSSWTFWKFNLFWLVVSTYPSEKWWSEFVSWDVIPFPTEWKNNTCSKPPSLSHLCLTHRQGHALTARFQAIRQMRRKPWEISCPPWPRGETG